MRKHEHRRDPRAATKVGKPRARVEPGSAPERVLRLQCLSGNGAVAELLASDRHEREADAAADRALAEENA